MHTVLIAKEKFRLKIFRNIIIFIVIIAISVLGIMAYKYSKNISLLKKDFSVVGVPYGFVFDMEQEFSPDMKLNQGVISVYDENTRSFAAFGHPIIEDDNYMPQEAVVLSFIGENSGQFAGKVTRNTFVGCFGEFVSEYVPPIYKKMKLMYPNDIKEGKATLLMLDDTNTLKEYESTLSFNEEGFPLLISVDDKDFKGASKGASGSVVLQDGKITAIVCAGNKGENADVFYGITAYEVVENMTK